MPVCVSYKRMDELVSMLRWRIVKPLNFEIRSELIAMIFELKRCRKKLGEKKGDD